MCIMLTVVADNDNIFEALQAGASGYLLKGLPPLEILTAIADAVKGGSPMSSAIARKVVRYFHKPPVKTTASDDLSPREKEILQHLMSGKRYKEIASDLSISEFTVRNHLRKVYEKLQVNSGKEAMLKVMASK